MLAGKALQRQTARAVWRLAQPYRMAIAGFLVAVVLQALFGIVPPLVLGRLIDSAIPANDRAAVVSYAGLLVGVAALSAVVGLVERFWSASVGERLIYDLRLRLFDHVQHLPLAFFTRTQTGVITSRLNSDVIGAQRALTSTLGTVVSNVITLSTTLVAMLFLEWRLTILAVVLAPLFLLPYRQVGIWQQQITRQAMDHNAEMSAMMTERFDVAGARLVKLFGRHDAELGLFERRAGAVRKMGLRSALFTRSIVTVLTVMAAIGTALVYGVGGLLVISETFTVGELAAMGLLVGRVYSPLTGLVNARIDVLAAMVSFERVFEVLDAQSPLVDADEAVELPDVAGRVVFDQVSFHYPAEGDHIVPALERSTTSSSVSGPVPVLRDVSFAVEPGQMVAIVGPSGAGKSTIGLLLCRLYDVNSGAVTIDGVDIRGVTQASLRSQIGVVSQDPHLFHDSIRANLTYARPEATDADLVRVCRAAQIWDLVGGLPDGLDTVVGERGYRMSGGEKQRLSIARLLLKDPAIVLLDEATSHLDAENEGAVQSAMAKMLADRTSVVIAHRLSTVVEADTIVVVDDGKVVERGTHAALLDQGGMYSSSYRQLLA